MDDSREEILGKLKKTTSPELIEKPEINSSVYSPIEGGLIETFTRTAELAKARVFVFNSEETLYTALKNKIESDNLKVVSCHETAIQELLTQYKIPFHPGPELPADMDAGITGCEFLVAHTGSAMVSSAQEGGRRMFVCPPAHFIVASESQVVDYLETAYQSIIEKYQNNLPSLVTIITGPSRTADIEKTLVLGAHGPKELNIFILKN
jgi:L-lactate dehydrogenase complex protein LldG